MGIRITPDEQTAADYKDLLDRLPDGKQCAVSMKTLAADYGMKTAELRAYVLRARIDGVLILSGQQGFYLPEDVHEVKEYVSRRKQVICTAQKALNPFIDELGRLEEGCAHD